RCPAYSVQTASQAAQLREKEETRILYTTLISGYIVFFATRHVFYTCLDVTNFTYLPTLWQTV
ncbi:MAG: hypothetical protein ACK55Z_37950, partial [bacterium]